MPINVYIDLERSGERILMRTPYRPSFVDELKARIPSTDREWGPEQKVWVVTRDYWNTARGLIYQHYGSDTVINTSPAAKAAEIEIIEDSVKAPDMECYFALGIRSDADDALVHLVALFYEWAYSEEGHAVLGDAVHELRATHGLARDAYRRICRHRDIPPYGDRGGEKFSWIVRCGSRIGAFMINSAFVTKQSEDL